MAKPCLQKGVLGVDSDLPLVTTLTLVSVAVLALCIALTAASSNLEPLEMEAFASLGGNAFLMAFVGAGMIFHLLSSRSASSSHQKGVSGAPQRSFFHEMRSTTLLGAGQAPQVSQATGERQASLVVRVLFYLLAICIPAAGSVTGAAMYIYSGSGYRLLGRKCIIVSLLSLGVFTALLLFVYAAVHRA